jgi:hypothetical protein
MASIHQIDGALVDVHADNRVTSTCDGRGHAGAQFAQSDN